MAECRPRRVSGTFARFRVSRYHRRCRAHAISTPRTIERNTVFATHAARAVRGEIVKPLPLPRFDGLRIRAGLPTTKSPCFMRFYALVHFATHLPFDFCRARPAVRRGGEGGITLGITIFCLRELNTFIFIAEQNLLRAVFAYLYARHINLFLPLRTNLTGCLPTLLLFQTRASKQERRSPCCQRSYRPIVSQSDIAPYI